MIKKKLENLSAVDLFCDAALSSWGTADKPLESSDDTQKLGTKIGRAPLTQSARLINSNFVRWGTQPRFGQQTAIDHIILL